MPSSAIGGPKEENHIVLEVVFLWRRNSERISRLLASWTLQGVDRGVIVKISNESTRKPVPVIERQDFLLYQRVTDQRGK